jgi:hypothetical protein
LGDLTEIGANQLLALNNCNTTINGARQMIPHRMLSNEITGNGLRNRVTACRKRLRESRVLLKAQADINVAEELFPEAATPLMQVHNYAAGDFEASQQTEELEVGIT